MPVSNENKFGLDFRQFVPKSPQVCSVNTNRYIDICGLPHNGNLGVYEANWPSEETRGTRRNGAHGSDGDQCQSACSETSHIILGISKVQA